MHPRTPNPRGVGITIVGKVDVDHAGGTVARRSRTVLIVRLNSTPVHWHSKKRNSAETSSFGSELVVMKQLCECIQGLACKLRMVGMSCEGPAHAHGDNQSALANAKTLESTLKEKSLSLACYLVREGVAMDDWRIARANANENEADLLTKVLPFGEKRPKFVRKEFSHVCGSSWITQR